MSVIRILCLHGYRHNKDLLMKSMRTMIKKGENNNIQFDFINSPNKHEEDGLYQWWNADKETILTLENYDTAENSVDHIKNLWNDNNYDGILGFSQGSLLTQLFCHKYPSLPKFAILASTFPITDIRYKNMYDTPSNIPTILMIGKNDNYVTNELSLQ